MNEPDADVHVLATNDVVDAPLRFDDLVDALDRPRARLVAEFVATMT
ncbi:hypothetical protein [Halopiger xanaduensis]|nr:hypothetical protein [Halopiger xanaduensis]